MLFINSNPTASRTLHITGSSIPIYVTPNITTNALGYVTSSMTGSDGHIYVVGNANQLIGQAIVQCPVPFVLSAPSCSINGNILITSYSYNQVTVNSQNGTIFFSFPNLAAGQAIDYIYRNASSLELQTTYTESLYWSGSSSLGNNWQINNQNNAWTNGIDFSGLGMGNITQRYVTLISPQYGITCNHAPPQNGELYYFYGTGSNLIDSSSIVAMTNLAGSDVLLIQFSRSLSSQCTPSWVLPTNWQTYIPDANNSFQEPLFPCIIPNVNLGTIEVRALSSFTGLGNYEIIVDTVVPNCLFTSNTEYNPGQSGAPVMALVGGKRVFLEAIHYSDASGPMISNSTVFNFVSNSIAPQTMSVVNMSGYQSVF